MTHLIRLKLHIEYWQLALRTTCTSILGPLGTPAGTEVAKKVIEDQLVCLSKLDIWIPWAILCTRYII